MSEVEHKLSKARGRQRRALRAMAGLAAAIVLGAVVGAAVVHFAGGFGRLQVSIAPAEALAIATVEIVEGRGVVWNSGVWTLPGPLTLRVGAEGFVTETVAVGKATRARAHVDVVLRERPAMLTATTEPGHADTRWFLDGALVARGARLTIELPGGEHTVSARQVGYMPVSHTLNAERGAVHDLTLRMTRVRGRIEITSEPSGARVTRSGEAAGTTPLSLEIEGGVHTLGIALPGYATRTDTVEITHDSPAVQRHYRLARARARVSFELSPEGGVLTVDDRAAAAEIDLAAGVAHRVRYAKPGYAPQATELTLDAGERRTVALALGPVFGTVEVRSDPEAEIVVDGRTMGRTPKRLQLQTVPQTIRLTRDGYRTETRTVTPEANRTRHVEVTLRLEAQVRLETAPAQYTNGAGITLKLFRHPGAVTLGTPRGEPGRRANEFVRKVQLDRAFYAGVHEVTAGQFRRFTHPGEPPSADRRPVAGIGWGDAARFCNWLSVQEGLTPVYRFEGGRHAGSSAAADGYRLPTEAEWEWLARKAGRDRQTRFPWGDDTQVPPRSGNLADESARGRVPVYIPRYDDGFAGVAEVGKFAANASGLHDLAGNASEWVHDVYDVQPPRAGRTETDPMDTRTGRWHTVKGSSWRSGTLSELRAAWRAGSDAPKDDLGFRVARYVAGGS